MKPALQIISREYKIKRKEDAFLRLKPWINAWLRNTAIFKGIKFVYLPAK